MQLGMYIESNNRKRLPEVFCKKKLFLKILQYLLETTKLESFLIKLQAFRPQTWNFIKKRLQRWCFPMNIAKY